MGQAAGRIPLRAVQPAAPIEAVQIVEIIRFEAAPRAAGSIPKPTGATQVAGPTLPLIAPQTGERILTALTWMQSVKPAAGM